MNENNIEGTFHRAIRGFMTKRSQGYVMGAFRAAMQAIVDEERERTSALVTQFLAALDQARSLDRPKGNWTGEARGTPAERTAAWRQVNELRTSLRLSTLPAELRQPRPVIDVAHTVVRCDYEETDGNEAYDSQFAGAHVLYCVCPAGTPIESVTSNEHLQLVHEDRDCTIFRVHAL